jgi:ElaB/YqjD/DUF883 family membrane-anchored ribosome-binding protein
MASERDPGRPEGSDVTGGGLGGSPNPIGGGSVGGGAMGDRPGTGSVHSDVRTGPGEQYGGLGFGTGTDAENARQRAASATREFADDVRDRAEHLGERARDMADDVRTKAERLASDARGRLEDVRDRAEDFVGEGGITARIRENPVAALAIGFGLGYLIAGRGARRGPVHFAKSKLRKALFGAATAALLSEARGLVTGELRSALLGDDDDDDRPRRPSHRERF